jgi:hypothetical protein
MVGSGPLGTIRSARLVPCPDGFRSDRTVCLFAEFGRKQRSVFLGLTLVYLLVTGSLITSESESGRCLPLSPSSSSFYKHPKPVNESMEYDVVLAR